MSAVHDLSDGGLLVAVAEMALAGDIGVVLDPLPDRLPAHALAFGEDQGRYLVSATESAAHDILEGAGASGLPARRIGLTGGDAIAIDGEPPLSLAHLGHLQQVWLPNYMGTM